MRIQGCGSLALGPLTGPWYRALRLSYWKTRLSTDHTTTWPSRISAASASHPLYRTMYLAGNHQVAFYEAGALLGLPTSPVSNPSGTWLLMMLELRLHHVADLCDPGQQKRIATNTQELTGIWANSSDPTPTQRLGQALFDVPALEAAIYPSSKPSGGRNLIVFPDKLGSRSRIEFRNEISGKTERLK